MNWGKCSNCETMVQFTPGSKRVKCGVCNTLNLPVTTGSFRMEWKILIIQLLPKLNAVDAER